ncbi:MAG TPA: hypothetical protein VK348_09130 [Planctomycetota bacterium]|nr:hypothetical protein [Planctomycetota bacterium]
MTDHFDEWSELDDTLVDAPSGPGEPRAVSAAARQWLAEQWLLHGLLRALHGADAEAREQRVRAITERLGPQANRPPRWQVLLAAAALLLVMFVAMTKFGAGGPPSAEAAVVRAGDLLEQAVDRAFELTIFEERPNAERRRLGSFELTTRPGMKFHLQGGLQMGPMRIGPLEIGCDGQEIWVVPVARNVPAMSRPLTRAKQVLANFSGILDVGYLDVQGLVRELPQGFELSVTGRERGSDGHQLLHVSATRLPEQPASKFGKVDVVSLVCDESTGMVRQLEVHGRGSTGRSHAIVIDYLGPAELDTERYQKPK